MRLAASSSSLAPPTCSKSPAPSKPSPSSPVTGSSPIVDRCNPEWHGCEEGVTDRGRVETSLS